MNSLLFVIEHKISDMKENCNLNNNTGDSYAHVGTDSYSITRVEPLFFFFSVTVHR